MNLIPEDHGFEKPAINEDLLVLLDVDRAILLSDAFSGRLDNVLLDKKIATQAQIDNVIARREKNYGNAFDTVYEYEVETGTEIDPDSMAQAIFDQVMAEQNKTNEDEVDETTFAAVLAPGTLQLINTIYDTGGQLLLVTAGGEKTQQTKLALIRLIMNRLRPGQQAIPSLIIKDTEQTKATTALTWFNEEEELFVGSVNSPAFEGMDMPRIQLVWVIDDKPVNTELPPGVYTDKVVGKLVQRLELPDDKQQDPKAQPLSAITNDLRIAV